MTLPSKDSRDALAQPKAPVAPPSGRATKPLRHADVSPAAPQRATPSSKRTTVGALRPPRGSVPDPTTDLSDCSGCWGNLRQRAPRIWLIRMIFAVVYIAVIVGAILVVNELAYTHAKTHLIAWCIAGIAIGVSVPVALHDLALHLEHYVSPEMQFYYILVVLFVPIYGTQSWLALRYFQHRIYFVLIREIYEGYVLYCFYKCMVVFFGSHKSLLGGSTALYARLRPSSGRDRAELVFPFCCLPGWKLDETFVRRCTWGVGQFFVLRVIFAVINVILGEP